jgi:hypothetical protein
LVPGTTYYFRGVAEGIHGVACGGEGSFATPVIPPSVAVEDAVGIGEDVATIGVNLVSLGSAETVEVCLMWGMVQGGPYLNETVSQQVTSTGLINLEVGGLVPGTTYYYAAAVSADGVAYSAENSFSTLPSALAESGESLAGEDSEAQGASSAGSPAVVLIWVLAAVITAIAALALVKMRPR